MSVEKGDIQILANIGAALRSLNDSLGDAATAGIDVELQIIDFSDMSDKARRYKITARLTRTTVEHLGSIGG